MVRIQVVLSPDEADALVRLTAVTLRRPKDEIRLAVRRELSRHGLLHEGDSRREAPPREACHV